MPYKPDPVNDPNEIYAVIPTPADLGGPTDWWTVTVHGIPVWHFPPDKRDLAERFATDPAYRQPHRAALLASGSPHRLRWDHCRDRGDKTWQNLAYRLKLASKKKAYEH